MSQARGFSTLELLVVLAILGIVLAVTSVGPRRTVPEVPDSSASIARDLRRRAIRGGTSVTSIVATDSGPAWITALPDGRILTQHTPPAVAR